MSDVLMILEDQIRNYGGTYGVRDINLLSSAIYMPQASFDGKYLHKTIPEMAAAYTYHLCQNHPFVDGNKRTALTAALVFLDINGYSPNCGGKELYDVIMNVANGKMNKQELIEFYKQNISKNL
jgi:death-on-curing protein